MCSHRFQALEKRAFSNGFIKKNKRIESKKKKTSKDIKRDKNTTDRLNK
jgi:hypothetical protein